MFSFVGDTVFDPFLGSGTTSLTAKKLQRNSIGYEINENFLQIIKRKIGMDNFTTSIKQENLMIDFKQEINKLPYKFSDPLKFDKKIDLKKLRFGSRIDNSDLVSLSINENEACK